MISAVRICPKCGWGIPADAPEGGCPGCLLESGLRLLEEEAVAGGADPGHLDIPARTANKSERIAEMVGELGDYELLEEVGRGGQGVVFRARQKSLNRTVALKVISLGQWASKVHLKRFRREAEAAASLDHPNIVPIYEVGERDGSCYFSMKFVEGGQLDEVVRQQPISIRRAAELIAKVARTVHHAHEHGILHRDIKPGNILLDQKGEPNLTDFGLARLLDAESTVTRTVEVMGTPSYMAPEQACGKNAELTSAADVYGLGAVLYQLLTGQPPFAGGTTYETIKLLLDSEPRPPRSLNPKIDRELSTICLKCLDKDPKRRYPSALALAEDLKHWLKHEPITARPSGFFTHARKWIRRNPSTAVQVALLLALAVGLSLTLWNRKPPVLIPKSVAVLPFENLSDDPNNAYFADGIQQEILTRLASIADLKVISRASTQRYHSSPGNLAEIAKQLGVANVVEGSVQKAADQVRVSVQLINTQTDSHLWAESYDRKLTDVLGVESDIAKRIAESLHAKLTGREEQALAMRPTNNPEAYDAYLRGLAFEARASHISSLPAPFWEAPAFYKRAVQLDPKFAVAWARLSRTTAYLYFDQRHANAARRDEATRALDSAQKLDPNSPETLLALGYYQYWVLRDYERATNTFGLVHKMLPNSSEVLEALGFVARRAGHWDQSIAYFEQALAVDPRNVELLTRSAGIYLNLRQFPAALKLYDRALDVTPFDPDVMALKAGIYQAQGDLEKAAKLLSQINEQNTSQPTFIIKITQLRLERNYGQAVRLLQSRLTQSGPPASEDDKAYNQVLLAFMQRLADDAVGAKLTAQQARSTLEQLNQGQSDNAFVAATLSQADALIGEKDLALNEAQRAIILLPRVKDWVIGPGFEQNLALIESMFGENSRAVSTLTELLQLPYDSLVYLTPITPALLRLDPIWDSLRGDPAFQKLCEEKIDKSIAVLPFENLSGDPNNAYFAEGIQEEILTQLAKIADLKVISRTSTSRYKSKPDNLAKIANELGVANIVEGSVQKTADQVRVNVQLLNAQTDSHVWADTYDRKLTDIFGVESEIAKRIAESLQAKLSGREEQALAVKPTNSPEAYDAYLRGLAFGARGFSLNAQRKATEFLEAAVQLDPNFAIAWARLSRADAQLYFNGDGATRDAAERALENAQKLAPTSPETLLALGLYQYWVLRDYAAAKTTFGRVREMLPGSSEVPHALGRVTRREGHWDESVAYYEQALTLDPRNVELLMDAAWTDSMRRQFPAALKLYDRALDSTPNDPDVIAGKASIYQAQGDLQEAASLLTEINAQTPTTDTFRIKIAQLRLERNYDEAIRLLRGRLDQFHFDSQYDKVSAQVALALIQQLAGDKTGAKVTAKQARNTLEQLYTDHPTHARLAFRWEWLSQAYAVMGERDAALKAAEHAIKLLPRASDAPEAPRYEENLALIQTILGENSRAISTLTQLLQTPYCSWFYRLTSITPALLRLDPVWDPLRGDPGFQKLCEEKRP